MKSTEISTTPQAPIIETDEAIYKHHTQIVRRICTELGVPENCIELMDAFVLSVPLKCKRDQEFILTDHELAKKISSSAAKLPATRKRIYRMRTQLKEWQDKIDGPRLVLVRTLFNRESGRANNHYRFPFIEVIGRVASKSKFNASDGWTRELINREIKRFLETNTRMNPMVKKREIKSDEEIKRGVRAVLRGLHMEGLDQGWEKVERALLLELVAGDPTEGEKIAKKFGMDIDLKGVTEGQ